LGDFIVLYLFEYLVKVVLIPAVVKFTLLNPFYFFELLESFKVAMDLVGYLIRLLGFYLVEVI